MLYKLDTDKNVFFYEQEFYCLSNFSSFKVVWRDILFDTSEHAYHWEKFTTCPAVQQMILRSMSAHEAFQIAQKFKHHQRKDWDSIKIPTMKNILRAKVYQHEYVRRKVSQIGDRMPVEDSWRDDFWGWGPNKDGKDWMGRLWKEIQFEVEDEKLYPTPWIEASLK